MRRWQPAADRDTLLARSRFIGLVRDFFHQRGVLEVTTPLLVSAVAPERFQTPPSCQYGYLQTSPETAMKRLVAAGTGSIFQICPAFRADEAGRLHNPEFTMLEWYRPGWGYRALMEEVSALVQSLLAIPAPITLTFQQAFQKYVGIDPFSDPISKLKSRSSMTPPEGLDRSGLVDFLLLDQLEPSLKKQGDNIFLYEYPAWDPAMAEVSPGPPPVALRFELYIDGVEIANGYQELTDASEQKRRLDEANRQRLSDGLGVLPVDDLFLAALQSGFPRCAGVALGMDRLLMLALKKKSIAEVMTFPSDRC
ncbi:MAG: EF-P lysine aminoacylase GenX [Magnetococcales bacterium]|nr:EF-P lysine aminoacylase GenX [Magnetococcales bacterium]